MAIATLSVDLVAKLASFERDMGKAARASEKTASQIAGAFGLIKSAAIGLGAGIGIGGLIALTRSAVDSIDALNDVSDATGSTIESVSALENVAKRTGATLDTVAGTLVKFNQSLNAAKPDSPIARSLAAIGLEVEALKRLDPAEALRQTAVALAQYADDGNKARLVQELFGKSVREIAPFLKDLAEAGKLNATVTAEQAAEADKFNKQLFQMQASLQDVSRSLVGPVITGMNGLIDKFKEGSKAGEGFIVTMLRQTEIARLLGLSQPPAINTGGASGSFASAGGGRGFVNPATLSPSVGNAFGDGKTPPSGGRPGRATRPDKELDLTNKALQRYVEQLESAIERTQDLSAVEEALLFLRKQGAGASADDAARVLSLARQIDATKELTEANEAALDFARQAAQEDERAASARQSRLDSLLSGTATQQEKERIENMRLLTEAYNKGEIATRQFYEGLALQMDVVEEKIEKSKSLAEELGLTFTSAFEDAIVGGKGLGDVLKGLEQDILRIVTRKLVTDPLGNALTSALGGGGSGGGIGGFFTNMIGKLFSADGGGFTGNGPRSGGLDGKGGFLMVGHPQETITDHTKRQSQPGAGRSMIININQAFAPGTNRATTMQAAADARRQLEYAGRNL